MTCSSFLNAQLYNYILGTKYLLHNIMQQVPFFALVIFFVNITDKILCLMEPVF